MTQLSGSPLGSEVLAIMAKAPRIGSVKTRLARSIGQSAALDLYRAFLEDLADLSSEFVEATPQRSLMLSISPAGSRDEFVWLDLPTKTIFVDQPDGNLGVRINSCFDAAFDGGAERVCIIGADAPTLTSSIVDEGFQMLESGCDLALGPTEDGGYYLVGCRARQPHLFDDIPWSTGDVLECTLDAARRGSVSTHLLETIFDVDEESDLTKLIDLLRLDRSRAPRTATRLERLIMDDRSRFDFDG